jgi:Rho termination factor, N-terminal domain
MDEENERQVRRELRRHFDADTTPDIETLRIAVELGILPLEEEEPVVFDAVKTGPVFDATVADFEALTLADLKAIAQDLQIAGRSQMNKSELIAAIRAS